MSSSRRNDSDSNDPTVRLVRTADAMTGAIDDFVRAVVNFTLETTRSRDPVSRLAMVRALNGTRKVGEVAGKIQKLGGKHGTFRIWEFEDGAGGKR